MCAMDFDFILNVAERRIKAALGKVEAGKVYLQQMWACSIFKEIVEQRTEERPTITSITSKYDH